MKGPRVPRLVDITIYHKLPRCFTKPGSIFPACGHRIVKTALVDSSVYILCRNGELWHQDHGYEGEARTGSGYVDLINPAGPWKSMKAITQHYDNGKLVWSVELTTGFTRMVDHKTYWALDSAFSYLIVYKSTAIWVKNSELFILPRIKELIAHEVQKIQWVYPRLLIVYDDDRWSVTTYRNKKPMEPCLYKGSGKDIMLTRHCVWVATGDRKRTLCYEHNGRIEEKKESSGYIWFQGKKIGRHWPTPWDITRDSCQAWLQCAITAKTGNPLEPLSRDLWRLICQWIMTPPFNIVCSH